MSWKARAISGVGAALLGVAVLAVAWPGAHQAQAAGEGCTAFLAGAQSGKKTPVELVVFNTTATAFTLDLIIRDPAGIELVNRPGEIAVAARATAIVSIEEQLSRDLDRKTKPYEGIVSIELVGDSPFDEEQVIVHATQYFGKRSKPKGAVVFRPLFELVP